MALKDWLTIITVGGFAVSFVTGALSQLFKTSIEIQGVHIKRLTPAGWLSLCVSVIGLAGSVGAALLRVTIENQQQSEQRIQAEVKAAQEVMLREQEQTWRRRVDGLLSEATENIRANIENTIRGFQRNQLGFQQNQARFNEAQIAQATNRETLLRNSLRQTNQIILAGQPLTSLRLRWDFGSADRSLWRTMNAGEERIRENAEDVQGGMPVTPFAAAEYQWSLLPLLSNLARTGDQEDRTGDEPRSDSTLVLIPLDDSQNAILSFGEVPSNALVDHRGKPVAAGESSVRQSDGGSTPWVTTKERRGRLAHFGIEWNLDPATLAGEVSRRNAHIAPTASLPQRLGVILLHDIRQLPVQPANYSIPRAVNLWDRHGYGREKVSLPPGMAAMRLTLEANGFRQITYAYRLARAYRIDLRDEYDDDIDAGCLLLEFELL